MNDTHTTPSSTDSVSAKASAAGQQVKDAAREAGEHIKQTVSSTASKIKESAADIADQRRTQAADQVGRIGQNIHSTARSMENEDPNIAHYAHRIADRLDNVADYVRNRDLAALKDDAADLARRHPVAFLGGLFVAGLVIGNIVKAGAAATLGSASNPDRQSPPQPQPSFPTPTAVSSPAGV